METLALSFSRKNYICYNENYYHKEVITMKGLLKKQITYGGWIKMTLIGTGISMIIMVIEFICMGIISNPFKKKTKKDNNED
jgi:hypothetical protein